MLTGGSLGWGVADVAHFCGTGPADHHCRMRALVRVHPDYHCRHEHAPTSSSPGMENVAGMPDYAAAARTDHGRQRRGRAHVSWHLPAVTESELWPAHLGHLRVSAI
jgi:hypothetical protein